MTYSTRPNPITVRALKGLCACLLLTLTLSACDSVAPVGDAPELEAYMGATMAGTTSQTKHPVCHLTSDGEYDYVLIDIADPALDTHIAHGDGQVGYEAPFEAWGDFIQYGGPIFGADCTVVDASCVDGAGETVKKIYASSHPYSDSCRDACPGASEYVEQADGTFLCLEDSGPI